jgi:hypothetical protein
MDPSSKYKGSIPGRKNIKSQEEIKRLVSKYHRVWSIEEIMT